MKKRDPFDSLPLGMLIGIALPLATFAIVYLLRYQQSATYQALGIQQVFRLIATPTLSLCAIANLLPFYLLLRRNKLLGARGVVVGTIIVGIIVFILYALFKR